MSAGDVGSANHHSAKGSGAQLVKPRAASALFRADVIVEVLHAATVKMQGEVGRGKLGNEAVRVVASKKLLLRP